MALTYAPTSRLAQWFDGSATFASVPLNLSAVNKLTISFWLWWNAFGAGDNLAMEFTTNLGSNQGGWFIDPNKSATNNFGVSLKPSSGTGGTTQYNRQSANVHTHIFFEADLTQTSTSQWVNLSFNGVTQSPTSTAGISGGTNPTGTFANSTLYIMSRAGASLFAAGALSNLALFTRLLNAAELALLVRGADPRLLHADYFWRMNTSSRSQSNLGTSTIQATMTSISTSQIAGPAQIVYPPTLLPSTEVLSSAPATPATIPSAPQIWSPLTLGAAAWKMGKLIEENRPLTRRGLLLPRRRIAGSGE